MGVTSWRRVIKPGFVAGIFQDSRFKIPDSRFQIPDSRFKLPRFQDSKTGRRYYNKTSAVRRLATKDLQR